MLRKLYTIEDELKEKINEDINNPEIFNLIYELSFTYLCRSKRVTELADKEGVSLIAAEELYMYILRGHTIYQWCGYVAKTMISYIRKYRQLNCTQVINFEEDDSLREAVIRMSTSESNNILNNSNPYDKVCDYEFLSAIPGLIEKIIVEYCRFESYSPEFLMVHTTIIYSLTIGYYDPVYTDPEIDQYCRFLYGVIKDKLIVSLRDIYKSTETNYYGGLSLLQIAALEGTM